MIEYGDADIVVAGGGNPVDLRWAWAALRHACAFNPQ